VRGEKRSRTVWEKKKETCCIWAFFIPNGYAVQLVGLLDSPRLFDSGSHVIPLLTTAFSHRTTISGGTKRKET
jgi:hypothetical protein